MLSCEYHTVKEGIFFLLGETLLDIALWREDFSQQDFPLVFIRDFPGQSGACDLDLPVSDSSTV